MTLVLSNPANPNSIAPTASFAELFRTALLSECQATMERVCNEVMNAIEMACKQGKPEVSTPGTIQFQAPDTSASEEACPSMRARAAEAQRNSALARVLPRMMMLDMDFGGNLTGDSVCQRFGFSRKRYSLYKRNALAIWRCYKVFGGELGFSKTCKTAKVSRNTAYRYIKIMKEGFNA